jgi:hypothetical protein
VSRAQAFDDWRELERRTVVEEFERSQGIEQARRQERVQEELLEVKERVLAKIKVMVSL